MSVQVAGPNTNIVSKQDPITKVCGDRPNRNMTSCIYIYIYIYIYSVTFLLCGIIV